jgi:hypothetical protein
MLAEWKKLVFLSPSTTQVFFDMLDMVGFFFSQKGLLLVVEVLLEGVVLEGRMKVLLF